MAKAETGCIGINRYCCGRNRVVYLVYWYSEVILRVAFDSSGLNIQVVLYLYVLFVKFEFHPLQILLDMLL